MNVIQFGKFEELQVQLQKPTRAMMKLALTRTVKGKEIPEFHLL